MVYIIEELLDWMEYIEDVRQARKKGNHVSTTEKAHEQVEKREYYQTADTGWLVQKKEWKGIKSLGMEEKTIWNEKGERKEYWYYISSLAPDIKTFKLALERGEHALAPGGNISGRCE